MDWMDAVIFVPFRTQHTQEHTIWLLLTEEATKTSVTSLITCLDGGLFYCLSLHFFRMSIPASRVESSCVTTSERMSEKDIPGSTKWRHGKNHEWVNSPWRNRIGCIYQTPCCARDWRRQRPGWLPDPAPKKIQWISYVWPSIFWPKPPPKNMCTVRSCWSWCLGLVG